MEMMLYLTAAAGGFWVAACLIAKRSKVVAVILTLAGSAFGVFAVGFSLEEFPMPIGVLVALGLWGLMGLAYRRTEENVG